jgi:hypothetical protein
MPTGRHINANKFISSAQVPVLTANAQTDVNLSSLAGIMVLQVQFTTVPSNMRVAVSTSVPYAAPSLGTNPNALSATGFMVNKTGTLRIESVAPITGFHVYNAHGSTDGACLLEMYRD